MLRIVLMAIVFQGLLYDKGQCAEYAQTNLQRYNSGMRVWAHRSNAASKINVPYKILIKNAPLGERFSVPAVMTNGDVINVFVIGGFLPNVIITGHVVTCDYRNRMKYSKEAYEGKVISYQKTDNTHYYPIFKIYNTGEVHDKFYVNAVLASGRKIFLPIINHRVPQTKEWCDNEGKLQWISLDYSGGRDYVDRDEGHVIYYFIKDKNYSDLPSQNISNKHHIEEGKTSTISQEGEIPQEGETSTISQEGEGNLVKSAIELKIINSPAERGFSPLLNDDPIKGSLDEVVEHELLISKSWPNYETDVEDLEDVETNVESLEREGKIKVRNSYLPNLN